MSLLSKEHLNTIRLPVLLRSDIVAIGLLCLLCSLVFAPLVYLGRTLYWGDIAIYFHPLFKTIGQELHKGNLPLWNTSFAGGEPLVGNPQAWMFYPTIPALTFISPERYLTWTVIVHIWLAGVGLYVYLRSIGLRSVSSWFGAAAFMLDGALVARGQFPNSVQAAAYLPWFLWAMDRLWAKPGYSRACLLSVVTALMLLSAHPQMAYMAFVLGLPYGVWRWNQVRIDDRFRARKARYWQFGALILALMLAAPQIVTSVQGTLISNRETLSLQSANRFMLSPEQALNPILPSLFGNPHRGNYIGRGNYWETCCYVGLLPMVLAIFALFRVPTTHLLGKWKRFWGWTALLSYWLALGSYGGLYLLAYRLLPGLKSFHDPARWLFLMSFAICALGALGLERWMELRETNPKQLVRALRQLAIIAVIVGVIGVLWALVSFIFPGALSAIVDSASRFRLRPDYPFLDNNQRAASFRLSSLESIGFIAVWLAIIGIWMWLTINRNRIKMEWWAALACLILAVDAGSFASRLLPSVPANVWGEARKQTLNKIGGQLARGRSFTVEPWAAWWRHISYVSFEGDYEHLQRLMGSLTPNLTSELGFLQADAYEPMIMQRSNSIVNAARKAFQGGDRRADPLLDNLCVGSLIYTSLDWLAWVQNRDLVLPRAGVPQEVIPAKDYKQAVNLMESQFFDIHQAAIIEGAANYELGSGTANLVLDTPSRVDLEVKLAQPSWVILRDAAAPGWQAFIDGKPTRWYCADIMFRAVRVGEGEHQVSFSYRPACYIFGLYCALIGIVIVAGVTGFSISKRFNTSF